jgi:hypothetical protein
VRVVPAQLRSGTKLDFQFRGIGRRHRRNLVDDVQSLKMVLTRQVRNRIGELLVGHGIVAFLRLCLFDARNMPRQFWTLPDERVDFPERAAM